MESITLQPNNQENKIKVLLIIAAIFLSVGVYHLMNFSVMLCHSVEIVQTHGDMQWESLSEAELPNIEKSLENILREVKDGLPLTPEQMQKLQALYKQLQARGGRAGGIVAQLIALCEQILMASGTMELYLEHLQNGHQDEGNNDIPGVERK